MIKALHFIWSASFGGIEKVVMDLCKAQNETGGVTPTLLIGTNKGLFRDLIADSGIRHIYAGFRSGTDFRPALFKELKKVMSECDIIHLHTFNPLVFLAAISSKKPVVYTIHGNFNFGRKMRLSDRVNQMLRRYFFNSHTNLITFNSTFTRETAFKRYGLKNANTVVIHNGIPLSDRIPDQNTIHPEHTAIIQNKFVVGTSSRFVGFKRIDRLIDAFHLFASGKDDVVLMLVGDGVLKKDLETQVKKLGIENKTLFTGFSQEVRAYQNAMNVCVFPSCGEPFGLVAVETLSLGKPTLAFTDAGGMLEILLPEFKDDIAGSIEEMAKRIEYYYLAKNQTDPNSDLRIELASRYAIEPMRAAIETAYKSVLPQ